MNIVQVSFLLISVQLLLNGCNQVENSYENSMKSREQNKTIFLKEGSFSCMGERHTNSYTPINILSKKNKEDYHNISVYFQHREKEFIATAQEKISNFKLDSIFVQNGESYRYEGVHFHSYPEHLIDGISYPMEMHIVNKKIGEVGSKIRGCLVIVCLFKIGETNSYISSFLKNGQGDNIGIKKELLSLNKLFNNQLEEESSLRYYNYQVMWENSTKECIEWFVSSQVYTASANQIHAVYDHLVEEE